MFKRLKLRFQDMRTLAKLIPGAELEARKMGEEKPGAEHYLLSALNLPDGTAKKVFERIGATPEAFKLAIQQQYMDALNNIGIESTIMETSPAPVMSSSKIHSSQPSGQAVMKALYELKNHDKDHPLLGAHIINVIANMEHGVAVRAFKKLGLDRGEILSAVEQELATFH